MTSKDQMGRTVALPTWPPQRIVSLVPSQTELLAYLGLDQQVLGITKFCIHPSDWFQQKQRVGGTKTIDFQKIESLKPDLIIGNKEENERAQIAYLAERYPVWMSDIYTLDDALAMMRSLGALLGKEEEALALAGKIAAGFATLATTPDKKPSVAYLIWQKPYMAAASGTFVDDMLSRAGFENVFAGMKRYPEINAAQLASAQPTAILLSSEPFPFKEKHIAALREICPRAQVRLVDGELFSWYGSRLLEAPAYFSQLRKDIETG